AGVRPELRAGDAVVVPPRFSVAAGVADHRHRERERRGLLDLEADDSPAIARDQRRELRRRDAVVHPPYRGRGAEASAERLGVRRLPACGGRWGMPPGAATAWRHEEGGDESEGPRTVGPGG